jgi:hypothetical protein
MNSEAWDKQPGETDAEHLWFATWLSRFYDPYPDRRKPRSVRDTAAYYGVPLNEVSKASVAWGWEKRGREYDTRDASKRVNGELDSPAEYAGKRTRLLARSLELAEATIAHAESELRKGRVVKLDIPRLMDVSLFHEAKLRAGASETAKGFTDGWDLTELDGEELAALDRIRRKCARR